MGTERVSGVKRVYVLAGALLLAVLVAYGIAAQLFATTDAAQSSSIENAHPTLYAHGDSLRPLVEETDGAQTLNIYGPGGQIIAHVARDGSGGQEARHPLADHLGSTRAALDADGNVVARFEYGPHGETAVAAGAAAAQARYRYTGHPWDEAQGLYQTPARGYDPTTGRFLSVDADRQSTNPYSYASNNPTNKVDPDGFYDVYFFLYSGYGTVINEIPSGTPQLYEITDHLIGAYRSTNLPFVAFPLEAPEHIPLSRHQSIRHVTTLQHGEPGYVQLLEPGSLAPIRMTGWQFADYQYERLRSRSGASIDNLRSFNLLGCDLACRPSDTTGNGGQSAGSFLTSFADRAHRLFPTLERVTASSYQFGTEEDPEDMSSFTFRIVRTVGPEYHGAHLRMSSNEFVTGDFPPAMYRRPDANSVGYVYTLRQDPVSGYWDQTFGTNSEDGINSFLRRHGFDEPVFREISFRAPAAPLVSSTPE